MRAETMKGEIKLYKLYMSVQIIISTRSKNMKKEID